MIVWKALTLCQEQLVPDNVNAILEFSSDIEEEQSIFETSRTFVQMARLWTDSDAIGKENLETMRMFAKQVSSLQKEESAGLQPMKASFD